MTNLEAPFPWNPPVPVGPNAGVVPFVRVVPVGDVVDALEGYMQPVTKSAQKYKVTTFLIKGIDF